MTALTTADLLDVFIESRPRIERLLTSRLGCPQAAQDLAQDLFFKIERIADRLPTSDDARRYLLRMAANAATDHHRVEGRRAELLAGIAVLFDDVQNSPENAVIAKDEMVHVEEALRELPSKCRDVLFMSRMEGMTHGEIATRLGVSKSLVEKYAAKALLHCRIRLGGKSG